MLGTTGWGLVLLVLACAHCAHGICNLTLSLDPSQSTFAFGGSVVSPLTAELHVSPTSLITGFQGSVLLTLAGTDPCPSTGAEVVTKLAGATLSTTDDTGPLSMFPTTVMLASGTLVNITWSSVEFGLETTALTSAGGGASGVYVAQTRLEITGGGASQTSLLAANQPVSLLGVNGTNASSITASAAGQQVNVTLSDLNVTMVGLYEGTFSGAPLQGITNYTFVGVTLAASVALGCNPACGAHGRCTLSNSTAGSAAEPACECECGWTGAACDLASGFCSAFPRGDTCVEPAATPSPPPPASPSDSPCVATQTCGTLEVYNTTTAACECQDGWGGTGCTACQHDAACSSLLSGYTQGTCSGLSNFTDQTAFLSYQCDLAGTGLDDIIVPGTFFVYCNTTGSASSQVTNAQAVTSNSLTGDGEPYCNVNFAMRSSADNPITCRASNCVFQIGTTIAQCSSVSCTCETTCPLDLQGVLDVIEGNPCTMSCNEATGECTFDIQDFFVTLIAPCTNKQCMLEGYTAGQGSYVAPASTHDYNPVIAAVPVMALVALVAFLSTYLLRHPLVWKGPTAGQSAEAAFPGPHTGAFTSTPPAAAWSPLALRFEDIACTLPAPRTLPLVQRLVPAALLQQERKEPLRVLHGVSGYATRGDLVGLVGPSGSGKTTLLGVLSGASDVALDPHATLTGRVTLEGEAGGRRHAPAFVPQDDTLLPMLSVEECVRYAALLKAPPGGEGQGGREVAARVSRVLRELGLDGVAGSRVGGATRRGISGGERRRVSIAMELVADPQVLILDEPTSGLDSFTALNLMFTLKAVAKAGRIVVLSFHQPSPAMFSLLDRVYLLAQGRAVFGGPPTGAEDHFAALGLPCPAGVAIAEHMLHAASDPGSLRTLLKAAECLAMTGAREGPPGAPQPSTPTPSSESLTGKEREGGGRSTAAQAKDDTGQRAAHEDEESGWPAGSAALARRRGAPRSLSLELAVLFWRAGVDIIRNPSLLLLHWAMALGMGIFTGCIFLNVGLDISGAQNRAGGLFFILAFFAFTSLTAVDLFMAERQLVTREVQGGMYHPACYLITKASLDGLLLRVIPAFLYAAPFYPMMGLQSGSTNVALFLFLLTTFVLVVGAFALAVSVGCSTAGKASLVMNVVLLISLLVGGFFVNVASIAGWIRWLHYLSVFFYAYAALVTNEVATLSLDFVVEGYAAVKNVRGVAFLNIIGVDASDLTRNIIILDCLYAGLLLIALAVLWLRMPRAARVGLRA